MLNQCSNWRTNHGLLVVCVVVESGAAGGDPAHTPSRMENRGSTKGSVTAPDQNPDRLSACVGRGRLAPLFRNLAGAGRSKHFRPGPGACLGWRSLGRLSVRCQPEGKAIDGPGPGSAF